MPPARRKSPRQLAPQTIEEATEMLGKYMQLLGYAEQAKADADVSIQAVQTARDGLIAPVEQQIKEYFKQLRAWWAVAKDQMTDGKRKSVELSGCLIGERTGMPSLKLPPGMKVDEFVKAIEDAFDQTEDLLRTKVSLDKQAIIKTMRGDADNPVNQKLRGMGASVKQSDEFFIDRAGKKDADPELVDVEDGEEAA